MASHIKDRASHIKDIKIPAIILYQDMIRVWKTGHEAGNW